MSAPRSISAPSPTPGKDCTAEAGGYEGSRAERSARGQYSSRGGSRAGGRPPCDSRRELDDGARRHPVKAPREVAALRRRLAGRGFAGAAMTLIAGAGAGQLIGIITAPIITRLYSPTEFGVYSVAVSILVVSVIACLRYDFAILLPSDDLTAANLLALSLAIDVLTSLVLAVVLISFGPALLTELGA